MMERRVPVQGAAKTKSNVGDLSLRHALYSLDVFTSPEWEGLFCAGTVLVVS